MCVESSSLVARYLAVGDGTPAEGGDTDRAVTRSLQLLATNPAHFLACKTAVTGWLACHWFARRWCVPGQQSGAFLRFKGQLPMRKRRLLLAAGASVATVALTMGTAIADPVPAPPPYPPVVIVGAQTTQDLFDTMCNKNKDFRNPAGSTNTDNRICQSWGVDPQPSNIVTRDPVAHPECSPSNPPGPPPNGIPRPKQGGDGTDKLVAFPSCIDVARVVTDDSHSNPARAGKNLTYIPMATDVLAYAISTDSDVNAALTKDDLKAIYTCDTAHFPVFDKVTGANPDGYQPLLGSFGAGNRTQLFKLLGITNDAANYTDPGQPGECITDKDSHGVGILANDGRVITNSKQLITYSVAPWLAQLFHAAPDIHGNTTLGSINGISPAILNASSFGARTVYNVVRNSDVPAGPIHDLFVGPTSKVCQDTADIKRAGFNTLPNGTGPGNCGDPSITTP
jgi:hypothetical protein